jgi:uncharacterized damage-inducible protein DinB
MASHLDKLTEYNLWANEKISNYIDLAGEITADKEILGSFHSIRKTMFHIWDAQVIWMKRLNGESLNTWPSHSFKGNLEEAIAGFIDSSMDYVRFTKKLTNGDHYKIIEYHSTDGTAFLNSIEDIVMHVMNHSTYHRGQIITMLRLAGFDKVGSTDFIRYKREKNN